MTQAVIYHIRHEKWVNNMDSIKCQALLLAIQHGSLTAAGKELGYTQSGITRMIQSLEEEIGFPLLVRNNQGVQLSQRTPNDARLSGSRPGVPKGRRPRRCHSRRLGRRPQRRCYYSIAAAWMPKILSKFQELYPNVSVHLMEGTIKNWPNGR